MADSPAKAVSIQCPQCSRRLKASREKLGRSVKCPACGHRFKFESSDAAAETPPFPVPPKFSVSPPSVSTEPEPPDFPPPEDFRFEKAWSQTADDKPPVMPAAARLAPSRPTRPRLVLFVAIAMILLTCMAVAGYCLRNEQVNGPLQTALGEDSRNHGIEAIAYYDSISGSQIVFDLQKSSSDKSRMDVQRVLFMFADGIKKQRFDGVFLAFRGEKKFHLKGDYFQQIGRDYGVEKPMYLTRTFPENAYRLDGKRAFPVWEGGLLGVVKEQMEDLNKLHDQWYIDSYFAKH